MNEVRFLRISNTDYSTVTKSDMTFYYVTDTEKLYLGEELLSNKGDIDAAVERIATLEGADTVADSVANKIKTAIEALDGSATIASKSGDVVTLKAGITEADGIVSNNSSTDITLSNVASTGAAADVSITDSGDNLDATNVETALAEIVGMVSSAQSASTIILSHESGSLTYSLYQGQNDNDHKIGDIVIPQDMVATSGSLYVATSEDSSLVEGNTYIEMTIANGDPFYIPVQDLIDVYTGTATQTGVEISVTNGAISATIKTLDGSKLDTQSVAKTALSSAVQASLDKADSAVQSIAEGSTNGTVSVDGTDVSVHGLGSAAYANTSAFDASGTASTAIAALDGSATIATKSSNTVTLRAGISEVDGVVSNDSNANIVLADVASTGTAADVGIVDSGNLITATNVEAALQEIMGTLNGIAEALTWQTYTSNNS